MQFTADPDTNFTTHCCSAANSTLRSAASRVGFPAAVSMLLLFGVHCLISDGLSFNIKSLTKRLVRNQCQEVTIGIQAAALKNERVINLIMARDERTYKYKYSAAVKSCCGVACFSRLRAVRRRHETARHHRSRFEYSQFLSAFRSTDDVDGSRLKHSGTGVASARRERQDARSSWSHCRIVARISPSVCSNSPLERKY